MSNANLRRFFSDINEKFSKGFQDLDEHTVDQVKMDVELLRMILQQIRTIRQKKETMLQLETNIKVRNELITEFTEIIANLSEQFKQLTLKSTKENCYLYSPYNNTKPLSSHEILNYAKKISHSLQAPKKYIPDSVLPANFVLPFPTEDNIFRSYAYFNSRTDGKVGFCVYEFVE